MENEALDLVLTKEMGLTLSKDHRQNRQLLIDQINELLVNDFQQLVSILYRMDVSEPKLKLLLKENPDTDAARLIADLMIERQAQKIKSRKETKQNTDIPEDEKW